MNNIKVISIGAVAQAGKDTFFNISKKILNKNGYNAIRFAYADAVKRDLDSFLKEKVNISAFTTDPNEKTLIRPFIVSYSTNLMRKINPNVWIEKTELMLDSLISDIECFRSDTDVLIGSDLRFVNELKFIHNKYSGVCVHLRRYTVEEFDFNYIQPANNEEATNDPLVRELSDIQVEWHTVSDNNLIDNKYLNTVVLDTLNKTKYFVNNQLSL